MLICSLAIVCSSNALVLRSELTPHAPTRNVRRATSAHPYSPNRGVGFGITSLLMIFSDLLSPAMTDLFRYVSYQEPRIQDSDGVKPLQPDRSSCIYIYILPVTYFVHGVRQVSAMLRALGSPKYPHSCKSEAFQWQTIALSRLRAWGLR